MRGALWTLGLSLSWFALGCGSRSALLSAGLRCETDAECSTDLCQPARCLEGQCVAQPTIECHSDDPCLAARCVPETGGCEYDSVSVDLDGDGFYAPLPDGTCGNDCDDTSPRAYPGATEVCDRVDNDCDNVVDNGLPILPSSGALMTPVRIASEARVLSGSRGIAFGQGVFALGYRARDRSLSENQSFIQWRDASGEILSGEGLVSSVNVGSYGTPLAWSGQHFGAAWQDARSGNYEVYFTLFDPSGQKRLSDLRLTDTPSSSWAPEVIYDQGRFVVLWQEILPLPGGPQIRAQLISADGELIGGNLELTPKDGKDYGFVAVEANRTGYGIVYTATNTRVPGGNIEVEFRAFAKDLATPTSPPVQVVASGGDRPKIAALGDNFLLTWDVQDRTAIWGAILSPEGAVLAGPAPVTPLGVAVRDNNLVSFGDRVVLAWAELSGENYDIFGTVIGEGLESLEPKRQLVGGAANSIEPRLVRGDNGFVGALFDDFREGVQHAHFMAFSCEEETLK